MGDQKGFLFQMKGNTFTTLASIGHVHYFLHLPPSGSPAWGVSPAALGFTTERVQTKTAQIPSKSSPNPDFQGRQSNFAPATLLAIGSRNNFLVQNARSGSNKVRFLWKVMWAFTAN